MTTDALDAQPTRRTVLLAGGAVAALSACSSSASSGPAKKSAESPGHTLTTLADVAVGRAVAVKLPDGSPGLVSRISSADAVCFSAVCPHEGCTVAAEGSGPLTCPCHDSQFNLKTGARLAGPAPTGLTKVPVKISGGKVVTA